MDLFWSGLAQRATEHTWNERRSKNNPDAMGIPGTRT
jgi:hypothetical protein